MQDIMLFILSFMEITSIIILWSSLGLSKDREILKKFTIIISTSWMVSITNRYLPSTGDIINYIFTILVVKAAFNRKISRVIIEFCIVMSMGMLIQFILMAVIIGLKTLSGDWNYFREGLFINAAFLIFSIIIYRFAPVKRYYEKYSEELKKMYIFIINILIYVTCLKLIWDYNHDYIVNGLIFFTIATIAFTLLNVIFFVKNIKLEEQRKVIESHNKYSDILSNIMEEVRRRQHDFKNHLNTIYGIAEIAEETVLRNEVRNYIISLNSSLLDIDKIVYIKNYVISAVICSKQNEAKNKGINFTYYIRERGISFPIEDYELSEVLCNLLDNAFEASERDGFLRKDVHLEIGIEGSKQYIEVSNTGTGINPENVERIFTRGFSTKKEEGHGYGLFNVKRIVEERKGQIQLHSAGEYTTFKVLL